MTLPPNERQAKIKGGAPTMTQNPVRMFLETSFILDYHSYINFDVVWRRWVWFAQTHPNARAFWPYPAPTSKVALSHRLKQCWAIKTEKMLTSLKRGERDEETKPKSYTRVTGLLLKPTEEITWPGMYASWHPEPWIPGGSDLGNPSDKPDPFGYKILTLRSDKAIALSALRSKFQGMDEDYTIRRAYEKEATRINVAYRKAMKDLVESSPDLSILIPPPILD